MGQQVWSVGGGGFSGHIVVSPVVAPCDADTNLYALRRERPLFKVDEVYVHPCHRGRGWAQCLLHTATVWADRRGVDLALYVRAYGRGRRLRNEGLVEFYKRYGFRIVNSGSYNATRMVRRVN